MKSLPRYRAVPIGVVAVSVAVAALLGIFHLNYPFSGDQAVFSHISRMLDDGALLYEDTWDVKQPAVYLFYWAAGSIFGFSEIGVHALELIYYLGFSVLLVWLLKDRYTTRWLAAAIPLLMVGWYYAIAQIDYMTQVESLSGPLVFGTTYLVWKGGNWRLYWAGVVAGLAIAFKLALFPLIIALWLIAMHVSGGLRTRVLKAIPPLLVGGLTIVVPFLIWVASKGLGDRVWFTFITYPPQALELTFRNTERLVKSVAKFSLQMLPLILLGLRGLWVRRNDGLARIWAVWVIAGFITYLLQLWWGYLLFVMFIPLVLLALDGIDDFMAQPRRNKQIATAVLLVAAVPAMGALGSKAIDLAENGFGIGDNAAAYHAAVSRDYDEIGRDIDHLVGSGSEPIYVLGNPIYHLLTDRSQKPAVNGWSPETWPPLLWEELNDALRNDPPLYLLFGDPGASIAVDRSPETIALLESEYDVLRPSNWVGTWYVHKSVANP